MNRRVMINLTAFGLVFLLMIWWAVNNIVSFGFLERPFTIHGEFAATAGVAQNSEVAYLGVNVGRVSDVELADGLVRITMDIDRGRKIPAGSIARIFRKSAVGEPYIDFQPPDDYTDATPAIEAGDMIPLERTSVPIEFADVLRAASRVLGSVDPDKTGSLVHELKLALDGRGDGLNELARDTDALLATFAAETDLLDRLSANSTALTRTVTERRGALASALGDLAAVAGSLRAVNASTDVLLDRGVELLDQTADLVGDVKQNLDCALGDLEIVLREATTPDNLDNLVATLERAPTAFGLVYDTRDTEPGGVWVRVDLIVAAENPPEQYTPPRELPAVPIVPDCGSTMEPRTALAPGAGSVRPSSAQSLVAADLAAEGSGTPWGAVIVYLAGAALVGAFTRRSLHR